MFHVVVNKKKEKNEFLAITMFFGPKNAFIAITCCFTPFSALRYIVMNAQDVDSVLGQQKGAL